MPSRPDALPYGDKEADEAIEAIGLPSKKRYNIFVAQATEAAKVGPHCHPVIAQVFATLALAEATMLYGSY